MWWKPVQAVVILSKMFFAGNVPVPLGFPCRLQHYLLGAHVVYILTFMLISHDDILSFMKTLPDYQIPESTNLTSVPCINYFDREETLIEH